MKNGVKVIGGFAGTETAASQSNPAINVSIIDGGGNARAITAENCAASTVLRGFTIQNGDDGGDDGGGGGLLVADSGALFVQCIFKTNDAAKFGGAVSIRGNSSPHFVSCKFHDNGSGSGTSVTPLGGGAVFVYNGSPTFTNCLFYNNKAGEGGAIALGFGSATLLNCTVADNDALIGYGGGLFDQEGAATIKNSIFWDNAAAKSGDQIFNGSAAQSAVTYTDVQDGFSGTGNISSSPSFTNAGAGDYTIPVTSSCKDVGQNSALPPDTADLDWDANTAEDLPKDLGGSTRKIQITVDMGAYEGPFSSEG